MVEPQLPASPPSSSHHDPRVPRPRTARACSACNRIKLKCDGGLPCNRCVLVGEPLQCEYLPSLRGKTRKRKGQPTSHSSPPRRTEESSDSQATGPMLSPDSNAIDSAPARDFENWRKDGELKRTGPLNSALWKTSSEDGGEEIEVTTDERRRMQHSSSFSMHHGQPNSTRSKPAIVPLSDNLTTLPLPGDAHNPLSVLAEASATADADEASNSPLQAKTGRAASFAAAGKGKEHHPSTGRLHLGGYYTRLDRESKDEAPHIMSYINVHE